MSTHQIIPSQSGLLSMSVMDPLLDVTSTDDDMYKVCLTENGITKCTYVSSFHLVQEKEKGLRAAINRAAAKAFE